MPPPFALLEVADSTMRLRNDFGAGLFLRDAVALHTEAGYAGIARLMHCGGDFWWASA
ncbi:MAG: hypothetical protein AB7E10_08490 [Burkholderiaceae bacterium]|jgi:hypothetical protein|uniref:hypothetical protein n=1 Tax=Extensimonas perlucida TaxID=2590786 RepID=UPI00164252E4|nr:hypothetical protein [Extensimonas perlucida]MBC7214931.1 hypothetical protein [Burkholderiaceae bacterium]